MATKKRKRATARRLDRGIEPEFFMMDRAQVLRVRASIIDLFRVTQNLEHQLRKIFGGNEPRRRR